MGRLSIINMPNFPKLRGKFTVIQIEIPTGFLKVEKKKFNIHLEVFKSENAKNIFLQEKEKTITYRKCIKEVCLKTLVLL